MIRLNNLTVRYGKFTAVSDLSIEIPRGERFGLVGPNGAGKTTTMKTLAGLLLPHSGTAVVDGLDVVTHRMEVRRRLGYMVDFFGVYDHLSVFEYLEFFGGLYDVRGADLSRRISELLDLTRLSHKRQAMVGELSRGMKQRLYFARTLIHRPSLLVLDEPASGMDPRGRVELMDVLKHVNKDQGVTILISSHILDELEDLCTSVGIMEKGRLVGMQAMTGERSGTAGPARLVELFVHPDDAGKAAERLPCLPGVFKVGKSGERFLLHVSDDDAAVAQVVTALVGDGIRVLLPRSTGVNLQETFFRMTKGETI